MKKGLIVSLEGLSATGKSTTLKKVENLLHSMEVKFVVIKDTGSIYNEDLSRIGIDTKDEEIAQLLYIAQTITRYREIEKLKEEGYIIIVDRYIDSLYAYGVSSLLKYNTTLSCLIEGFLELLLSRVLTFPDITFNLTLSEEIREQRFIKREGVESEDRDQKQEKILKKYYDLLFKQSRRVVEMDSNASSYIIATTIVDLIVEMAGDSYEDAEINVTIF